MNRNYSDLLKEEIAGADAVVIGAGAGAGALLQDARANTISMERMISPILFFIILSSVLSYLLAVA